MGEAEPNSAIKDYVTKDGPTDWRHRETVQFLYGLFDTSRFVFFSPQDETQLVMPQTVIAIDEMRHDTLAAYRLSYNPNGLPFEIIMNAKWIDRPKWELAESLIHEEVHLFQEYMANKGQDHAGNKMQGCKSGYHNRTFVEIAEQIGLHPILGLGAHWRPADGQFEALMGTLGVEKPDHAEGDFVKPDKPKDGKFWWDDSRGKTKGKSTLTLYTADDCSKPAPCKLRAGRRDLHLTCTDCSGVFTPH